jgi:hypothetical protein
MHLPKVLRSTGIPTPRPRPSAATPLLASAPSHVGQRSLPCLHLGKAGPRNFAHVSASGFTVGLGQREQGPHLVEGEAQLTGTGYGWWSSFAAIRGGWLDAWNRPGQACEGLQSQEFRWALARSSRRRVAWRGLSVAQAGRADIATRTNVAPIRQPARREPHSEPATFERPPARRR